jgi:hypothetical protein
MNVTFRYGHVNDLAKVKTKDEALSEALAFVQHWKRDASDNLAPTIGTLEHVEDVLRSAIGGAA